MLSESPCAGAWPFLWQGCFRRESNPGDTHFQPETPLAASFPHNLPKSSLLFLSFPASSPRFNFQNILASYLKSVKVWSWFEPIR